jgi:hypothetical protein
MRKRHPIYGLVAEFASPDELVAATRSAREEGYRKMNAYSPFPVHGLSEALGFRVRRLPWMVLMGGAAGAIGGFLMQYYASVIDYPLNIGGRPLNSWPAFIPVVFEMTILVAAATAVLGMLALNGLPRLHHPLFNSKRFEGASCDRFILCIESRDARFDPEGTKSFLETLGPVAVEEVER